MLSLYIFFYNLIKINAPSSAVTENYTISFTFFFVTCWVSQCVACQASKVIIEQEVGYTPIKVR